jgi:alkylation response protein AidB-like acyl-CoA dehydrogenase
MIKRITDSPAVRAQKLAPLILAAAEEIELTQDFPPAVFEQIIYSGLLRLFLPKSLEGEEVSPSQYLEALIEIAKADGSVAWNMFVANSACLLAPHIPFKTAKMIWSDPKAVIAWGPPDAQKLQAVEGGYKVSGVWSFASGSRQATWMGAHGHVQEIDGSIRVNRQGRPITQTVLFKKDEVTLLNDWHPMGLRGTSSGSYSVENVFVPEDQSGTRETPECRRDPGRLFAFPMQGLYAVGVMGCALGLASAMMEDFHRLAVAKTPRGRGRLADDKLTQAKFAQHHASLRAAKSFADQTLSKLYNEAPNEGAIGLKERASVRLICSHGIQASVAAADWVHRAAGVSAIFPESPFERRFRDIHTLSQQIQSRAAHFEAVGEILLGGEPEVFF